jgi:hypothetical protein
MLSIFALLLGEKSGNVVIMGLMVVAIVEVKLVRYLLIDIVMKISYSKPFYNHAHFNHLLVCVTHILVTIHFTKKYHF